MNHNAVVSNDVTDESLVALFVGGNDSALEQLIVRHSHALRAFLMRQLGNAEVVDDVVQETFVRVWRNIDRFDTNKTFKTWMYAIAKNAAIDAMRKKKTIPFSVFDTENGGNAVTDSLEGTVPSAEDEYGQNEMKQYSEALVSQLSPKMQEVLRLRYQQEMSFEEIGSILGKPMNTVKSYHHRAIQALKSTVQGIANSSRVHHYGELVRIPTYDRDRTPHADVR